MVLQNRVEPDGRIVAETWRGTLMGNRGGRIHDPETKTLSGRKWASKRWIICVTQFKARQRQVMGNSYTELFFLDDVSALSSGHRPCFECRREDANNFAECWQSAFKLDHRPKADEMDRVLHAERTGKRAQIDQAMISGLPDGTMVRSEATSYAVRKGRLLAWSGAGYHVKDMLPERFELLTPPSIIAVLKAGFEPVWHQSAKV